MGLSLHYWVGFLPSDMGLTGQGLHARASPEVGYSSLRVIRLPYLRVCGDRIHGNDVTRWLHNGVITCACGAFTIDPGAHLCASRHSEYILASAVLVAGCRQPHIFLSRNEDGKFCFLFDGMNWEFSLSRSFSVNREFIVIYLTL